MENEALKSSCKGRIPLWPPQHQLFRTTLNENNGNGQAPKKNPRTSFAERRTHL